MAQKPQVSVVIPTYNRASYIVDSIASILDQKNPGCCYEVIVIDDGSTDDTAQRLSQFKDKIIYKQIPNSGRPAVPRNIGIKMAKGEIIAFQDSDDIWVPQKLHIQFKKHIKTEAILSYANAAIMDSSGKLLGKTVIDVTQGKSGLVFEALTEANFVSTLTVMVSKKQLLQVGGFDESNKFRGVEDYQLWLRLALKGKFDYTNQVFAHYRQHDQNISTSSSYLDNKKMLDIMKSLEREDLSAPQKSALKTKQQQLYTELAGLSHFPENLFWKLLKHLS